MEVLVTDVTGELSRIERRPPSLETGLSGELINGRLNRVGLRAPAAGANGELSCNNRRPRALVTGVDGVLSSRAYALDGGPGEGVRFEGLAVAEVTTHALEGGVEASSSGVA